MKLLTKVIFSFFLALLTIYVLLPQPHFPLPPNDSVQSMEQADTETPLKRAYFTDFSRKEVLEHYQKQFQKSPLWDIPLPTYRLNYPPEEAQTLIRDQTRSTFLEEIVHPLRESFFVNGFEPKMAKDDIWYKGVHYNLKITVKYYKSSLVLRAIIVILTGVWICFFLRELVETKK